MSRLQGLQIHCYHLVKNTASTVTVEPECIAIADLWSMILLQIVLRSSWINYTVPMVYNCPTMRTTYWWQKLLQYALWSKELDAKSSLSLGNLLLLKLVILHWSPVGLRPQFVENSPSCNLSFLQLRTHHHIACPSFSLSSTGLSFYLEMLHHRIGLS